MTNTLAHRPERCPTCGATKAFTVHGLCASDQYEPDPWHTPWLNADAATTIIDATRAAAEKSERIASAKDELVAAVVTWREADLRSTGPDDVSVWPALLRLRDAADRYMAVTR